MEVFIEDFIGRDFYHKDNSELIYRLAECKNGQVKITWNEAEDVYYRDSEVLDYLEKEIWILVV
jgi:hypothetical protein